MADIKPKRRKCPYLDRECIGEECVQYMRMAQSHQLGHSVVEICAQLAVPMMLSQLITMSTPVQKIQLPKIKI